MGLCVVVLWWPWEEGRGEGDAGRATRPFGVQGKGRGGALIDPIQSINRPPHPRPPTCLKALLLTTWSKSAEGSMALVFCTFCRKDTCAGEPTGAITVWTCACVASSSGGLGWLIDRYASASVGRKVNHT